LDLSLEAGGDDPGMQMAGFAARNFAGHSMLWPYEEKAQARAFARQIVFGAR
jgi:hypothetical protein